MEHLVQRSIDTMHHRFHEPLTLDDLARSARVSKFYFLRVFSRVTGVTPGRFLSAVRLQEAKRLLRTTTLNVADISAQVGYSSTGTFSRRFSESVGVSPTKYRHMAGEWSTGGPQQSADSAGGGASGAGAAVGASADVAPITPIRALAPSEAHAIHGTIVAQDHPLTFAYLGLFSTPILQGHPAVTAVVRAPGRFRLPDLPPGVWYLHAVSRVSGDAPDASPSSEPTLLVDMVGPLRLPQGSDFHVDLTLRPADWSHPPILSALTGMDPFGCAPQHAA
ncbi:helix-turn-helix transcriptional regulator [Streptomyces sp. NPDC014894]|uniref:helix-turn-helix transcriptional regulator n=1 Tax=unclassified Streptomyces TaxID=2593676 RepID=UPI0036F70047